jgi:hypothetical protein
VTQYIQFATSTGNTLLIELDEPDTSNQHEIVKAGLKDKMQGAVLLARTTFEEALEKAIGCNASAFLRTIKSLENPPNEAEMSFALKVTGEVGNVAVGKLGGEANYTIKLIWREASTKKL